MPIELPRKREIGFAWVDGVFWERWIKQTYGIDVAADGDRVIINDEDKKLYWDTTEDGNPINPSRTAILDTVKIIMRNPYELKPKSTVGRIEGFLRGAKDRGANHPFLTTMMFLTLVFLGIFWWRGRQRRHGHGHSHSGLGLNPGSLKESGNWGSSWFGGEKDGWLGGGSGGNGGKYD